MLIVFEVEPPAAPLPLPAWPLPVVELEELLSSAPEPPPPERSEPSTQAMAINVEAATPKKRGAVFISTRFAWSAPSPAQLV